jgi:hypothetical protein
MLWHPMRGEEIEAIRAEECRFNIRMLSLIFLRLNMSEKPQQAKVGKHRERIESPEA